MENAVDGKKKNLLYAVTAVSAALLAASVYLLIRVNDLGSYPKTRVGYVKSDVLLAQYKPAMAIQQRLQQESSDAQKDLEKRYKELQAMDEDIKKKSEVLSTQALAPHVQKMQTKQNEFLQIQQNTQQAVQQKQAQFLEPVFRDISDYINKYGKDHGFTMIFGTPVEGMIIYGDSGQDLTEILVSELNARVPVSVPVPYNPAADSGKK